MLAVIALAISYSFQANARFVPIDWIHDLLVYQPVTGDGSHVSCVWQERTIAAYKSNRYAPNFTEFPTEPVHICVYTSGSIQYGQYSRAALDGSYHYVSSTERAIAVSHDGGEMTPISNLPWDIRLLGSSGGPFAYAESNNISGFGLRLYDKVEEHLQPSLWGGHYNYELDTDYYTYRRTDGQEARLDGVSTSDNGKWVAFVINNFGVMRLNVETKEVKRIASYVYRNSAWPIQGAETSITDDGQYVLQSGANVSFNLIEVNGLCGRIAPEHDFYDISGIGSDACPSRMLNQLTDPNSTPYSNGLYIYSRMRVDEGAVPARIIYYDGSSWGSLNVVRDRLYYLALGDSYASGEGDLTIDGSDHYLPGTNIYGNYLKNIPRETCHISTRSYPMRIAEAMQLMRGPDMQSVACSGAVITDILTHSWKSNDYVATDYKGQSTQLMEASGPRLSGISNALQLQNDARSNYTPGRVQQIELVKKAQPKYITVMAGGNDVDFAGALTACAKNALPSTDETCDYAKGDGLAGEVNKIYQLYPKLLDFYKDLKEISPGSTIYVLGYPQFMDDSNESCVEMVNLYSKPERKAIRSLIAYADSVIRNAALDAGAKYIDISNSLTGTELCASGTTMTGLTDVLTTMIYTEYMKSLTLSDSMLAKYMNIMPPSFNKLALNEYLLERTIQFASNIAYSPATTLSNIMQVLSHPNSIGHDAIYKTMKQGLGDDMLDSTQCNEIVVCPNGLTLGVPNVASYFPGLELSAGTVNMSGNGKVTVGHTDSNGKSMLGALVLSLANQFIRISAGIVDGSIDTSQPVTVEIHSQPKILGVMTKVGDEYELRTTIPSDVAVGEHVLHIKGTLLNGQKFDVDTPIFVEGPLGDIDDDGIADTVDTCAFSAASGVDADSDGIDDVCELGVRSASIYKGAGGEQSLVPAGDTNSRYEVFPPIGTTNLSTIKSKQPIHGNDGRQSSSQVIVTIFFATLMALMICLCIRQITRSRN